MIEFSEFWLIELIRATLVLSIAALLAKHMLRFTKAKPQTRVLTWMLVLAPCWLMFSFTLEIPWLESSQESGITSTIVWSNPGQNLNSTLAPTIGNALVSSKPSQVQWAGWFAMLLLTVWLIGMIYLFLRYSKSYFQMQHSLRQIVRQSQAEHPLSVQRLDEFEHAKRVMGLRQNIQLFVSADLGPLLCWVKGQNYVIVPKAFWETSSPQQRSAILLHELAHVKRFDVWWLLIARVLTLPQWFNPFAWYALRQLSESVEMACDDEALKRSEHGRFEYAKSLVSLVEFSQSDVSFGLSATGPPVQQRIQRIVHPNGVEMKFTRMIAIGSLVLVSSFGLVRPELVAQNSSSKAGSSLTKGALQPSVAGFGERIETTDDEIELTIKTYDVSDLILPRRVPLQNRLLSAQIIEHPNSQQLGGITLSDFMPLKDLITSTVAADSWGENGKSISPYVQNLSLVISQTPSTHDQIQELLKKLRELNRFTIELDSFVALFPEDSDLLPAELGKSGRSIEDKDIQEIRRAKENETLDCIAIPDAELWNGQSVVFQNLNKDLWSVEGISVLAVMDRSQKSTRLRIAGMTKLVLRIPDFKTPRVQGELVEQEEEAIAVLGWEGIQHRVGVYPSARHQNTVSVVTIEDGKFWALDVSSMLKTDKQDRRAILIVNAKIKDSQKPVED